MTYPPCSRELVQGTTDAMINEAAKPHRDEAPECVILRQLEGKELAVLEEAANDCAWYCSLVRKFHKSCRHGILDAQRSPLIVDPTDESHPGGNGETDQPRFTAVFDPNLGGRQEPNGKLLRTVSRDLVTPMREVRITGSLEHRVAEYPTLSLR